jgi:hypothetical protein
MMADKCRKVGHLNMASMCQIPPHKCRST